MTTAWALLAVSSDGQADTLTHQRAWAEETAKAKGWDLARVIGDDREGVGSAKDGVRPIVRRLIAELRELPKASRPEWLLVIRTDRFARGKIQDTLFVQDEIVNDLGVRIWTRNDGEILMNSPEAEFMASFKGYYARKDNADRRDKATAVYKRKRAAGLAVGNKRAYGLEIGPAGVDVPVREQAEIVKMAFDLRLAGHGFHRIAQELEKVAPPVRYSKSGEHPIRWTSYRVRYFLKNRAYLGTIIDEVTFRRVQQINAELKNYAPSRRRHPWPLSGVLRCYCGTSLIGQSTGKDGSFRYYTCRATWNHGGKFRLNPAKAIEAQFVALLRELDAKPELIDRYRQANLAPASPALLQRAIRTARIDLTRADKRRDTVWAMAENGHVRVEDVQQRIDVIAEERAELLARIAEMEAQLAIAAAMAQQSADAASMIAHAAQEFERSTVEDQQVLARAASAVLGGFCVEEDRTLTVRRPVDVTGEMQRRSAKRL
ncbi:MAG: site-specific recombinase, resolvase family [Candidatus Eremiobacteraeota bacterium]|nr:site-specific recombinase, resolvase family [Candidatus Eremiobacteraeota bacterium]